MKKTILFSLILIHLIACKKDEPADLQYPEYITAGNTMGNGISYSGIIADTLFFEYPASSANHFIDMNGDGINDFEIQFVGSASPGHSNSRNSISTIGNSFLASNKQDCTLVDTLTHDDTINNTLNWARDTCILYNHYWDQSGANSNTGLWNNVTNKYIGTKILVDDKTLFGWIHVEIGNGWNLTIIDYACTSGY